MKLFIDLVIFFSCVASLTSTVLFGFSIFKPIIQNPIGIFAISFMGSLGYIILFGRAYFRKE